ENVTIVDMINHFKEDRGALQRYCHIEASPLYRDRLIQFYQSWQRHLESLPYDEFSVSDQVDYQLLSREITDQKAGLLEEADFYKSLGGWVIPGEPLYEYETKRRRGHRLSGEELSRDLFQIREQYEDLILKLEQEKPGFSKKEIRYLARVIKGQKDILKSLKIGRASCRERVEMAAVAVG